MGVRGEHTDRRAVGRVRGDPAARIVTLTTDFGLSDHYVGTVKGAVLSVNPDVTIVDIATTLAPTVSVKERLF